MTCTTITIADTRGRTKARGAWPTPAGAPLQASRVTPVSLHAFRASRPSGGVDRALGFQPEVHRHRRLQNVEHRAVRVDHFL